MPYTVIQQIFHQPSEQPLINRKLRMFSPSSHCCPARPLHAHPQLRRPGIPHPDRRHLRHLRQLQRLRPHLALLPDASRHECQQKQRCTGRRIRTIHCQLRDLVDRAVHTGRHSSEEKRRPGIKKYHRIALIYVNAVVLLLAVFFYRFAIFLTFIFWNF